MCTTVGSKEVNFMKLFSRGYLLLGNLRCHGDDVVNICTEFHLHACYTEQVIRVKKYFYVAICLQSFSNGMIHMHTKFHACSRFSLSEDLMLAICMRLRSQNSM